jgi:nitrate reductase gamma subunit
VKSDVLFTYGPYAALVVFGIGCAQLLLLAAAGNGPTPPPRERAGGLPRPWRVAWCLLAGLHAVVLALPAKALAWNARPPRLYALEAAAFAIGSFTLAAAAVSTRRHLARRAPSVRELADSVFVSLLAVGVASGLALAVLYRWASSWGAAVLAPYLRSLSSGPVRAEYLEPMPFLVKVHVFAAFGLLAAAPFTTASLDLARRVALRARRRAAYASPAPFESPAFDSPAVEAVVFQGDVDGVDLEASLREQSHS